MERRYMCLWFCRLKTDWLTIRKPELAKIPFVFSMPDHNRVVISALNTFAEDRGLETGMRIADAKAILPDIRIFQDKEDREIKLLQAIGEWCIRYTPHVAVDLPDGLIFNISGCSHLWGGEQQYMDEIIKRFRVKGYAVRAAISDTIGAAWAMSRHARISTVIERHQQKEQLLALPPVALRIEHENVEKLQKLGFRTIGALASIPRQELRRRFGAGTVLRLMQAFGDVEEHIQPLKEPEPYEERLPCLEPIRTRPGIEIAIRQLLEILCERLCEEGKGIRNAFVKTYRVDGKAQKIGIGTNKASNQVEHLFKLFDLHIGEIAPGLGIELFELVATKVDDADVTQQVMWKGKPKIDDNGIAEFLDRIAGKIGAANIHRYLPQERYWPERSLKNTSDIQERPQSLWRTDLERPTQLLPKPLPIFVAAPIPDYPPMLFRHLGELHHVKRADGPERIEREWWLDEGEHRDYYMVEDQHGCRYWVYRSGHYGKETPQWYLHGYFA